MNDELFNTVCNAFAQEIKKQYSCEPNFAGFHQNKQEHENDAGYNIMMMLNCPVTAGTQAQKLIFRITSNVKSIGGVQFTVGLCYNEPVLPNDDREYWTSSVAELMEDILRQTYANTATVVSIVRDTNQIMIHELKKTYNKNEAVILKEGNLIREGKEV